MRSSVEGQRAAVRRAKGSRRGRAVERLEDRVLLSSVSGRAWNDADADGTIDPAGEPFLADWLVYLDQNRNRTFDAGEASTRTDGNGNYTFQGLAAGTYFVSAEVKAGWEPTFPGSGGAQSTTNTVVPPVLTNAPDAPLFLSGEVLGEPNLFPSDIQSNPLVRIDRVRQDSRFTGADGSGFSVVVLDSGIDLNHPFFGPDTDGNGVADRIVYHHDYADDDNNASDVNGHGSNVASIVGSSDPGVPGMAPGVNIIALKVLGDNGSGSFTDLEQALQWVSANVSTYNIAAINMSLGDRGNYNTPQSMYGLGDELAAIAAQNVIVASASGNDYFQYNGIQGVAYPAADANSLAIGAVFDANVGGVGWSSGANDLSSAADRIVSFTQRSTTQMDILAPGAMITGAGPTGGTLTVGGTSQASPHVAGLAAVAQQLATQYLGRRLTPTEFRNLIRDTGVTVVDGDDEVDNVTNTGASFKRIDAFALAEAIYGLSSTRVPYEHTVTLTAAQDRTNVNFGRRPLGPPPAPGQPDLMDAYDTGFSNVDDVTQYDNSAARRFWVNVPNVASGAEVVVYAGATEIARGTATSSSINLLTNGTFDLADGSHSITAKQTLPSRPQSAASPALTITVDTVAPPSAPMPDLRASSDTGASSTDNITRDATPAFDITSTSAQQDFLRLNVDGGILPGAVVRTTSGPGTYGVDLAGANLSFASQQFSVGNAYRLETGDVNGDKKVDLVVCGYADGVVLVLLNDGAGVFTPKPLLDVASGHPLDATINDFNADGKADIVTANGNAASLSYFRGNGDGTFLPEVVIPAPVAFTLESGDMNGDSRADLVIAERINDRVSVMIGNGNGTFTPKTARVTPDTPDEPRIHDADGDGKMDVIVSHPFVDQVSFLKGNGDGTFGTVNSIGTGDNPRSSTTGDFNHDGRIDAAVVTLDNIELYMGVGNGTFTPGAKFSPGVNLSGLWAGDVNGDGKLDAVTTYTPGPPMTTQVAVVLGNGDGTFFAKVSPTSTTSSTFDVAGADFNGDGKADPIVADYAGNRAVVYTTSGGDLGDGSHPVVVVAEDLAGNRSAPSQTLAMVIDTVAPVPDVLDVSPDPRDTALGSATVSFFPDRVTGLDVSDFRLTRNGGTNLLTSAQTVTTDTGSAWSLGDLSTLTAPGGNYELTLVAAGSGVADLAGNPLGLDASDAWVNTSTTPGPAQPVTLGAVDDAHVRDGTYSAQNFGMASELHVKHSTSAGSSREIYLKFDLTNVSSVSSAKLRLFGRIDSSTETPQVAVYPVTITGWAEQAINWSNRPPVSGAALDSETIATSTAKWYEWDVSSYLAAEKAAGRNVVTLALRSLQTSSPYLIFSSDEAAANKPELVVTPGTPPAPPLPTIVVSTNQLNVPEGGSASFTVRLPTQPAGDTTVMVGRSGDQSIVTATQSLLFTPANWDVPQTVTVIAGQDADSLNGQAQFSFTAQGYTTPTVFATEIDDEVEAPLVTLRAAADAYVRDGTYASQNFGTATQLIVKRNTTSSNTRETYLRFDLGGFNAATVATLRIFAKSNSASQGVNLSLFASTINGWSETGITWNNKPAAGTSLLGSKTVSGTTGQWYEFDVTPYVQQQKSGGATAVTFVLKAATNTDAQAVIESDESASASSRPQLVVTTGTPPPPPQGLVVSTEQVSVNEGGNASFTVKLAAQPTSDVTVTVARTSGDGDLTTAAGSLTFTPANWNVAQSVLLSAAEDADNVHGVATFTVSASGLTSKTVTATEIDNEAPAGPIVLRAAADAYVRDGTSAGTNFGSATELQLKKSGAGSNREIYFKFDLSTLSSISSAKLRVWGRIDSSTEQPSVAVYGASDTTWTESGLTWNNRPSAGATALATTTVATGTSKWYEWDVTSYLQAQKAAGATSVTLVLRSLTTTTPHMIFSSDEAATNRPELVVG